MPIRKFGTGEVLPQDENDQQGVSKQASTSKDWSDEDRRELEKENEQ